jgi:creatinine amidohydrolase
VRFTDLTYPEIADAVSRGAIAVVPTGCTEQQGPHLGVGFDSWFAEEICVAGAERVEQPPVLVLPAMPFGPTPEHRGFGHGYVDLPLAVQEAVVRATLESLAAQGFRTIVVWRGCGEHDLSGVVDRFNAANAERARAHLPDLPYHGIWCEIGDPSVPGGHADSFTTSIALHRHPELVRMDKVPSEPSAQPDWSAKHQDFTKVSSTGVVGDATYASAELGSRLWDACAAQVASTLTAIAQGET